MGTESVPEMSENLHILTQLSARENFIEFCRHESYKNFTKDYTILILQHSDKSLCLNHNINKHV